MSVFSGGLDHTVIAWEISRLESDEYQILYECHGHNAAIESLAMNSQNSHVRIIIISIEIILNVFLMKSANNYKTI